MTNLLDIVTHNGDITFVCEKEKWTESCSSDTTHYAVLANWLESCSIEAEVLRLSTKHLDIEIYPERDETQEQLTQAKNTIDSILAIETAKDPNEESVGINGDLQGRLAHAEALRQRFTKAMNEFEHLATTWAERVELALKHGHKDLAREAHSRQVDLEHERDLVKIKLQTVQELINVVNTQIKKDKDALLEETSSRIQLKDYAPSRSVEVVMQEIGDLIGLENIKQEVRSLVNSLQVNQMRQSAGLPNVSVSRHMVFYGNPGTGKTTIARRLGELFRLLGILPKGHFVETDRSSLVGGYLGQTAIKTSQVLDSALGGILFIDEAYTLSQSESSDQYGQEAIDTLLKYMEDHRDEIVIIVAGYEDLMGKFLESNPGLKSRFNKYFQFQDYSEMELSQIFMAIADESNYELDEETQTHLRKIAGEMLRIKTKNFGNGRTVRNLFERSIVNQANRIMQQSINSKDDLSRLTKKDILWEDMLEVSR